MFIRTRKSTGIIFYLGADPASPLKNQIIGRLVYEPLTERPQRVYGQLSSNYQKQGLKLSKHFKPFDPKAKLG